MGEARDALEALFHPGTVAVIGASTNPRKTGGMPVHNTLQRDFSGRLIPVNPGSAVVQGLPSVAHIGDIDGPVDCAIVCVPAAGVAEAVSACVDKGVRVASIFTSGFAEIDAAGAAAQERVAAIAREAGLRLLGPNSMGAFCLNSGFIGTFTTAFRHHGGMGWPRGGRVSIASQSGAVGVQMLVLLRERGVGLSKWVTTGNQCDVDIADCIDYYAGDSETGTILAYIEGVQDGHRLASALNAARHAGKPVIVLKVGRSAEGAAAAASHTASLAGQDAVYDAAFAQFGAHRASSLPEMIDLAAAAERGQFPSSPDIAIVSTSGGIGALMADEAVASGLSLVPIPDAARRSFRELAPFSATGNPIDTAASGMYNMDVTGGFVRIAAEEANSPTVIAFFAHLGMDQERFDGLHHHLAALRSARPETLIATAIMAPPENRRALEAEGIVVCEDPSATVACIGGLHRIAKILARREREAAPVVRAPLPQSSGEAAALAGLANVGIPVIESRLVTNSEGAAAAAGALGGPVALKISSADIAHKTEIGGVILGVEGRQPAAEAFTTLMDRARTGRPDARLDGVLVSPMAGEGVETILGVSRDPVFGPVVMFGIGGVFVETYRDVAFRVAPFGTDVALEMIREIRGYGILAGARGADPADVPALAEALSRLSAYAAHHSRDIESIDINPFLVRRQGLGAVALDALIVHQEGNP